MNQAKILANLVNIVFGIIEIFLGLRILLKLFGANSAAPFVNWIYETSQPLLEPFQNIFPTPVIEGGFVLELSTLFALVIYGLLGYLLTELIYFVGDASERRKREKEAKRDNS